MKRSPIKRTSFIARRSPLKAGRKGLDRTGGVNKVGRQGRENAAANAYNKERFTRLGVTVCELRLRGCTYDNYLSWAHGRKRRHLKEGELREFVILACRNCHWKAERRGEAVMTPIIEEAIRNRGRL